MRTQSNAVAWFVGAVGTLLVGCADDSGMDVANNPVADGSMPTNVTTVTDTAVTTTTVTMTVTSSGTGPRSPTRDEHGQRAQPRQPVPMVAPRRSRPPLPPLPLSR